MPFCPIKQYKQSAFAKAMADRLGGVNKQVEKHLCLNWLENRHLQKVILSVLLLLFAMSTGNTCIAQQEQDLHQPIRVRIFNLHNITAQQAKDYLVLARIADTILVIPGTTAVSVTGKPEELIQAGMVLKLVDSPEKFDVQLLDIDADKTLPKSEVIDKQLGQNYSVGSLMEGPISKAVVKAVVDMHKDKLLIISPQGQTQKITEAVQNLLISARPQNIQGQNEIQQTPEPQMGQQPQAEVNVPSPNDVVFTAGPVVIEPNTSQTSSPVENVSIPYKPKTEDDMLGDMLTELAKTAETEKNKTEPNQLPKLVVEPNLQQTQQQVVAEQKPAEQQQPQEPKVSKSEQKTEEIQKQPSTEAEPLLAETEQAQEKLPTEANESVQQQIQEAAVEMKTPVVPAIDIPNGDETLELNLPEKLDIVALVELVGKYLNLNYLYDETKVTGSVTIKVQGRLKVRELYDLLESVLKFRGFVMSRKGKLVTIAPAAEILDQDPTFVEGIKPGDVVVTNVFHLKYINTAAAKRLLGEMKLGSNITEIPETGTLVITEYAFRMQRIEDLLNLVDVPGPPKEFRLRILKYTLAESLVPKIQALAEQLGTVDVTIGATTPTSVTPTRTRRVVRQQTPTPQPTPETTKKTGVYIDFDKRTNRVLMIGLVSEITAVEQIIDSLDVPQQDLRVIREYEIQYIDIDKIVTALKEFGVVDIVGTGTTPGPKTAKTPQSQPTPVETTQGPVSLDQPQIVMLESTNSLLVNATLEQHIQISQIISYIDREPVQAAIPYRIYRLENQEPEALAEVLNNLIEKTVKDKEGKIQETVKYTEEQIAIVPDKNTFSLIVYASKKNQEWIGNLIETLDKRRPQVLIDVSLVEITRDDAFAYDLDVIANAKELATKNISVIGSSISSGFPTVSSVPKGTVLEGGYFNSSGQIKGFYNEGKVQALFTAMDQKKYGRVLARPKILVNDNETGQISTEDTTYIAQTTTTALPGQTQTDTVQTSIAYTPYAAKIQLEITPQISEGDLLRLVIKMVREDFGTASGASGGPKDKKMSNIDTIVTVPDGSTIILGGLTKLNQTKDGYKVPLLGDIPIAGSLFRNVSNTDKANKLYVFVRADILRPEETAGLRQLEAISKANQTEFEKAEDKFQRKEDFPGLKPTPVEPEKVLRPIEEEPEKPEVLTKK